jgi:lipid-binding SYLF domain-containing protein
MFGLLLSVEAQNRHVVKPTLTKPDETSRDRIKASDRAIAAADLFREIMNSRDDVLPQYILDNAEVIAIFPSEYRLESPYSHVDGAGLVTVRDQQTGKWGPPLFIEIDGGKYEDIEDSERDDLILVGMDLGIAGRIVDRKLKIGRHVAIAAGPNEALAEFENNWSGMGGFLGYLYSGRELRGVAVSGAKIKHDEDINQAIYGKEKMWTFRPITNLVPKDVMIFPETLDRYSKNRGV